jgi:pyrimidine oxygenase
MPAAMTKLGVFLPNGNNGSLISTTSPQFMPTWDLNREVTLLAERNGFEIALSMVKFRGFGGPSGYWDHALDSFTLMAGLAVATRRIQLFASIGVLALQPAVAARMAMTIDAIAPGRFGVNIVSGWQMAEYDQMGLWPGQSHFERRYEYCAEYVTILRALWSTGRCDFAGEFFTMKDCRLGPLPSGRIPIVCAGQSANGVRFAAQYGDYNFTSGMELNGIETIRAPVADLMAENARRGTAVGSFVLVVVILDETDAGAMAKWDRYCAGVDLEALGWRDSQAKADTRVTVDPRSSGGRASAARTPLPNRMSRVVGSPATVAAQLDAIAAIDGVAGIMLAFDDYIEGMRMFGEQVQPRMRSRAHLDHGVPA